MTPEAFQADTAIEVWIDALGRLREDEHRLALFQLDAEHASGLIGEMIHGFQRLDYRARMMSTLREISFGHTVDKQAGPAAIVCSETINGFVTTLGACEMPEAERPAIPLHDGGTRPAFAPRPASDSADTLPATPRAAHAEAWTDWVFTLEAMCVGNAKDGDAGAVNVEQNLRLGRVLAGMTGQRGSAS
jgi:hypothetical protein